ncbi:hypothetical protein JG688_00010517, partial [Phytophthora aleatoria]
DSSGASVLSSHSTHAEGQAALGILPRLGAGGARLALHWLDMRRLMSTNTAPSSVGDGNAPPNGYFSREGVAGDREQDARRPTDDKEEKTAEVNGDEEFFAPGHFPVDDSTWDGLETAYNFHLQLAPVAQSISCPICLRVTQFPVRQDCGHVLCWSCMQQSLSSLGDCPLCQAQQFFKAGKSAAPETEIRSMGYSYAAAGQDLHIPITSSGMLSGHYHGSIVQRDDLHYTSSGSNTINTIVSTVYDASRGHHDFLPNPSDIPLELDNLSDLDDVIDLDDLVSSFLIVVGGIVGKLRLNDLHMLDLAAQPSPRWIKLPISGTPPQSGNLLQVFIIGDDLYAIGGTIDGKFLTELHRLNLKSGEWKWEKLEVAGTPPSMRYWYSLTVLQGMAILYGGYGHSQRLSDTFALRFDTEIPTWVELQPRGDIPGPSSTHSVCVVKDRMYIFGGYDGKYRRGQLFAFEIERVSNERIDCVWHKVATQGHGPASRYTHSGASIDPQLIVYGGNTGCLKGDAYVLDLGSDEDVPTWKLAKCDPPLTPRAWHRAVVYNDAMYVFGGHTAEGNDNKVMRYRQAALRPPERIGGWQAFVSFALLCSVVASATSQSSSASGSGSAYVEFLSVGNESGSHWQTGTPEAEEIRFPTDSKTGTGDVVVSPEASSSEGSAEDMEIVASPVATAPLLVLKEMEATSVIPSSRSTTKEVLTNSSSSQVVSGSREEDAPRSMEPAEELHGVPSNPSLVNAVAFDGRAAVTWKAPDDDGLDPVVAYEVGWFDEEDNVLVGTQKRVVVRYEVEMSYDEVLFSPSAREAFEHAFTTEVASALQIPHSRLEITALERGSIVVFFQILPASRVGEKSLNDIVENLQDQLGNETSTLRSMGTFARRIESNGAKLSFSIADQTVAGGAEDISIAGLFGTMFVLAFFVSMFGWFLRRRHYRLLKDLDDRKESAHAADMDITRGGMKRMHIRSTGTT